MISAAQRPRPFQFERDTFAFPHELVWQYRFDAATGQTTTVRSEPPPTYYHRCFVMVRSVRQFHYHARFEPGLPAPDTETCRSVIRAVVSRDPRRASTEPDRVVVPGYDGLRSLSRAQEPLLKTECGDAWESYFLRSHWRMTLPVWRRHQQRLAERLERCIREGGIPVVHLFRFPRVTINHGIVLFGAGESDDGMRFQGYDPNIPGRPVELGFQKVDRCFHFPQNHYWAGGKLKVIEVYRNWLY